MPHGHCYYWTPSLVAMMVGSDGVIFLAYTVISLTLAMLLRQRPDLPFSRVLWLFVAFIFCCGLSHLVAAANTWAAAYWLESSVKAVTAGVSAWTAWLLVPLLPRALALRSPEELTAANEALSEANAALSEANRALEAKNAELDKLNAAYRQAEDARRRFVREATEGLRTPLSRMVLSVHAAEADSGAEGGARPPWADELLDAGLGILDAVDHLLVHSQLTEARQPLSRVPVDLGALVHGLVLAHHLPEDRDRITLVLPEDDLVVNHNSHALETLVAAVLQSVVGRADGGLHSLRAELEAAGERVRLELAWKGAAPRPAEHELLGSAEGTAEGLERSSDLRRLRAARDLTTLLGGTLRFSPTTAEGQHALVLELPVERSSLAPVPHQVRQRPAVAPFSRAPREAGAADIVLVEPDPRLGRLMVSLLQALGSVALLPSGEGAQDLLRRCSPRALVTAIELPGMDGVALCAWARAQPSLAGLCVVVVTADTSPRLLVRAMDAGADDHLRKPFQAEELVARVRSAVRLSQARDASVAAEARLVAQQETNSELQRLALAVSHDVRSPLRLVHRGLGMVRDDIEDGELQDALDGIGIIRERVDRIWRISDELLVYCREAWSADTLAAVDLRELGGAVVSLLAPGERGPRLELSAPPVQVRLPATHVEMVLRNLVSNAIQHHDRPAVGTVRLRCTPRHDGVELVVEDDGPGIPESLREEVFRLFRTAGSTGGSGVGLALVDSLVRRHGAVLTVEGCAPRGTRFRIRWPLPPAVPVRSSEPLPSTGVA
jgi:signal transduction histidine kinase